MKKMLSKVSNTNLMFNNIMEEIRMLSMGSTTTHQNFHITDFHHRVNTVIALVRPKNIMVYARGKTVSKTTL